MSTIGWVENVAMIQYDGMALGQGFRTHSAQAGI